MNFNLPSDCCEVLTMAYINKLDLSDKTPEEWMQIYADTYNRIVAEKNKIANESGRVSGKFVDVR